MTQRRISSCFLALVSFLCTHLLHWFVCFCSVPVALICSFLLGLGDSCYNTQLISIVGFLFREDSAPAFAVFKFVQV